MKVLKWILIILVLIAGLILVIPIFLPASLTVSAQTEIGLSSDLIFQNTAQFTDRDKWDPWLSMEPDAKVTIIPKPEYIGSTYEWEGEKIGTGKMEIDSVNIPNYIGSLIWFRDNPEASNVEWLLEDIETGTQVSWKFTSEGAYPFGRLMLLFMKGAMQSAFETGLADYKVYLEENPPKLYKLSEISIQKSDPTNAIVLAAEGNMQQIGEQMMTGYPKLMEEILKQGLSITGPAFAQYLDYDDATGYAHALLAFPVNKKGVRSGDVKPMFYKETEVVSAIHYGKYDYFKESYDALGAYVLENDITVTGEAFEVYLKSAMEAQNPMEWQTLVAFPIKK